MASFRIYEYLAPCFLFQKEPLKEGQSTIDNKPDVLKRLQTLVSMFKGTHNFHNYTRQLKAAAPQAKRYIIDMAVSEVTYQGREFFKFLITGQSFLYHQIRKMIGVLIQTFQEGKDDSFISHTMLWN